MEFKPGDKVLARKQYNTDFVYKGIIMRGPYSVIDGTNVGISCYDVEISNWEGKPVARFGDWEISIDKEWYREQRLNQLGISDEYYQE
jgi:hypothetical protein